MSPSRRDALQTAALFVLLIGMLALFFYVADVTGFRMDVDPLPWPPK